MALHNHGLDSAFAPFVEESPDIAFAALRPQTGAPNFLDYWRRNYGRFQTDYQGALGRQALSGEAPTLSEWSYLQNYPFLANYLGLSRGQRGSEPARRFAPRTRSFGFL